MNPGEIEQVLVLQKWSNDSIVLSGTRHARAASTGYRLSSVRLIVPKHLQTYTLPQTYLSPLEKAGSAGRYFGNNYFSFLRHTPLTSSCLLG